MRISDWSSDVCSSDLSYQRVHPSPMETCACIASMDKIKGELTVYGTFQAPPVVRTGTSLLSGIPEHQVHVIAREIRGVICERTSDRVAIRGYVPVDHRDTRFDEKKIANH